MTIRRIISEAPRTELYAAPLLLAAMLAFPLAIALVTP